MGVEAGFAKIGVDGRFAFSCLPAGEYEVFGQLRQGAASTPVTRGVTLAAEQDLDLQIGPEGSAVVAGTASAEGPLPDHCYVMLIPKGSENWRGALRGFVIDDQFELRGIPAGEYRALLVNPRGGSGSAMVEVPASGKVTVHLTLEARGR